LLDAGALERDREFARVAAVRGGAGGGVAQRLRQAVQIAFVQQHQPVGFVLQDILREVRAERREPAGDFRIARLLRRRQQNARADETVVGQFHQPLLLRR